MLNEEKRNFNDTLYQTVKECLRLGNPFVTEEEIGLQTIIFSEHLFGEVPEYRLSDVLKQARNNRRITGSKNYRSTFPINYFELINAWDEIEERERIELARRAAAENLANPVNLCVMKKTHLNEFGTVKIFIGEMATGDDYLVPCPTCKPAAHAQKIEEIKKERVEEDRAPAEIALDMLAAKRAEKSASPTEEKLSIDELQALQDEHNSLVRHIRHYRK